MSLAVRGVAWTGLYVVLALLPLTVGALVSTGEARSAVLEFGVALGFLAFAVLLWQFALVSRIQASTRPFGADALLQFHQQAGLLALTLVVAHTVAVLLHGLPLAALSPWQGGTVTRTGALALWATVLIAVTSAFRTRLRLSYEVWQALHLLLALAITAASVTHLFAAGHYSQAPALRAVLIGYTALFVALTLRYRLLRPLWLTRRPWVVAANDDAGGSTRLLRLRPDGHSGFDFAPGQFAWLLTGRTPLWSQQHPLSLASSAARRPDGTIEFAVKALGDWSGEVVPAIVPGSRVWVDGPYGAFSIDRAPAKGFVFIAGGIGIAPIRGMLLTMRDRGDRREVLLIHAAASPDRAIFREELLALTRELSLRIVTVFESPPSDWAGERGLITTDLLRRHLPASAERHRYFVCGPLPMMDAVEGQLVELGIPAASVDTERFSMV